MMWPILVHSTRTAIAGVASLLVASLMLSVLWPESEAITG
jgi:hypothetical protein